MPCRALIGLVLLCLTTSVEGKEAETLLVEFDSVEMATVVKWMTRKIGRNFVLPEEARKQKITVFSAKPVSPAEALTALRLALEVNGLGLVDHGAFLQITRGSRPLRPSTVDPPTPSCAQLEGVVQLQERSWSVPAAALDRFMGDQGCLARGARFVPAFVDGKAQGFKLFAIRPGSAFAQLGLVNGDVVRAVNGEDIGTADRALAAYGRIRDARTITLEVVRQGEPLTLTYRIQR